MQTRFYSCLNDNFFISLCGKIVKHHNGGMLLQDADIEKRESLTKSIELHHLNFD